MDLTFVDTNVLAYAHDPTDRTKHEIARSVVGDLWQSRTGALSTQVLQELYVVVTRKFHPPMSRRSARELVGVYSEWTLAQPDVKMILAASELEERHRLSFWDALVLEAAARLGASRLLSEDVQHGRTIRGVRLVNPFPR